jgi:HAD superfamily hydrolase (TIGR01509 family)
MPHRALIFDCDGTLVDSERLGVEVLIEVAETCGAQFAHDVDSSGRTAGRDVSSDETFVEGLVVALRGLSMAQCLADLEERGRFRFPSGIEGRIRERTAEVFRERLVEMTGAAEFVSRVTVPFCVASSGPRAKIELSLELTGLRHYFGERIFSSYDIQSWKPEPDLFLHAAHALGVEPAECGVIEDSQPGVDAGVAAGMFVYAFGQAPLVLPEGRGVHVADYRALERACRGLLRA